MVTQKSFQTHTKIVPEVKQVPVTVQLKRSKTISVPVSHTETRYKTEVRKQLRTRYRTVHDTHTVPIELSNCACYNATCGCIGQVGCGCCYPTCGCAPQIQLSTSVVARSVPENYEVAEVVKVPYEHTVVRQVPKIVVEEFPHTYNKTVVNQKTVSVQVPVYTTVPKVTQVPTTVKECWEEQVAVDTHSPRTVMTALRANGSVVQLANEVVVNGAVVNHSPIYTGGHSVLADHAYAWNSGSYVHDHDGIGPHSHNDGAGYFYTTP